MRIHTPAKRKYYKSRPKPNRGVVTKPNPHILILLFVGTIICFILMNFYAIYLHFGIQNEISTEINLERELSTEETNGHVNIHSITKETKGRVNIHSITLGESVGGTNDALPCNLKEKESDEKIVDEVAKKVDAVEDRSFDFENGEQVHDNGPIEGIDYIYVVNFKNFTEPKLNIWPPHILAKIKFVLVNPFTEQQIKQMIQESTFIGNGFKELVNVRSYDHLEEYSFTDAAYTLSHLQAIKQAHDDGHDMVMIVEDIENLRASFVEKWRGYADFAPEKWDMLNWMSHNDDFNQKSDTLANDFWATWRPYHWSLAAYTIRRKAMKNLLHQFNKNITANSVSFYGWVFNEHDMLVGDELLNYFAPNSYTFTFPCIVDHNYEERSFGYDKNVNFKNIRLKSHRFAAVSSFSNSSKELERVEKIAVVTSYLLKDEASIFEQIQKLNSDIIIFSRFHPNSRWFVNVVLLKEELLPIFQMKRAELKSDSVELHVRVDWKRFNKFKFVHDVLDQAISYDYILMKDSDIDLSGFEWDTFMNLKKDSIIAGPFHDNTDGLLYRQRFAKHTGAISLQNGNIFNKYNSDGFINPQSIETMFLEMFFVLMRTDFAIWFFQQIFTEEFLNQNSDWGVDYMWCGAANDFNQINMNRYSSSCSLVSVNIKHDDNREILKNQKYFAEGRISVDSFRSNETFSKWMDMSKSMDSGSNTLEDMLKWCKKGGVREASACLRMKSKQAVNAVQSRLKENISNI